MSRSVAEELEEIEQSSKSIHKLRKNKEITSSNSSRRGSSLFAAVGDEGDASGPYGRPSYLTNPAGDLLVDFPDGEEGGDDGEYDDDDDDMYLRGQGRMDYAHDESFFQSYNAYGSSSNGNSHNNNPALHVKGAGMNTSTTSSYFAAKSKTKTSSSSSSSANKHKIKSSDSSGVSKTFSVSTASTNSSNTASSSTSNNHNNNSGNGNKPRLGEAARMHELANSEDLPGGANHRPLVGGFAAAAYEAAKAHHYSQRSDVAKDSSGAPRDRPPPPCI